MRDQPGSWTPGNWAPDEISTWTPSVTDQIKAFLADNLFGGGREGYRRAGNLTEGIGLLGVPGAAMDAGDATGAFGKGNFVEGGILSAATLASLVPVAGRPVSKALRTLISGHNRGPRLPREYTLSGVDESERLRDHPSARKVLEGQDLPHGSRFTRVKTRQPTALSSHTSDRVTDPDVAPPRLVDIAELEGRDSLAIVGDNTGRHLVTGVNGQEFATPVQSMAGFQYMDVPGQGYAGAKSAQRSKFNEAKVSENPFYTSMLMAEESGDFSRHVGDIYSQMFRNATFAKKDIPKINESIRSIGEPKTIKKMDADGTVVRTADGKPATKTITVYPHKDFPGVEYPGAFSGYMESLPSGTSRSYFLKGLDKAGLQNMGVPKVSDARLAAVDAGQLGMDWGSSGYRIMTPDLEKGLFPTTSLNSTTYDTGIDKVGDAGTLLPDGSMGIPASLLYRDLSAQKRALGKGDGGILMTSPLYKSFEVSPKAAKQRIDALAVDTVSDFLEIEQKFGREAAIRYAADVVRGGTPTAAIIKAAKKRNAPWLVAALAGGGATYLATQPGGDPKTGLLAPDL
jgi:hypothetical protein